jgi:hypothetical protein
LRRRATSWKVAGSIPNEAIYLFQFTEFFQPHSGPGVCSVSNRYEYQKMFLGVKRGRRIRLTA